MYINRYTYEGGNPFLLPSLSHNITLGTTYKWVYLSAGYQYVKDAIISFSGAYSEDDPTIALGEFYQFNLSSCIRQQNSLTAQFVSFSLANLANIFYPPPIFTIINLCLL